MLDAVALALLAAAIIGLTLHTDRSARSFDATLVPPNTIPGMAEPRFFLDNDAYAWMAHTRDLMASGGWRIRHTFMDNAPHGREMHWSHPLIWTMRGLASAIMARTGWPAARAVELAGVWVMPLFQFFCLGLAVLAFSRKLGWASSALFCALALSLNAFVWAFHPLRPDHHGLQLFSVLGSFICLQFGGFGWVRNAADTPHSKAYRAFLPLAPPCPREAARWFTAAGFLGGLALWFGATIWMFALPIVGLAALSIMPLARRQTPTGFSYRPDLWRIWAWSGVSAGTLFYFLEYAPSHFSMRLEVNHPWHWLFWLGAAEGLRSAGRFGPCLDWRRLRPADWAWGSIGLLAAFSLPLAILRGPPEWHLMHVPEMQRLHARFIEEFRSIRVAFDAPPLTFLFLRFGVLPLVFPWVGWLAWKDLVRAQRAQLRTIGSAGAAPAGRGSRLLLPSEAGLHYAFLPGLIFSGLFLLLFLWQQRWGFFMAGGMVWLFIVGLSRELSASPTKARRTMAWILAGTLLANSVVAVGMRLRSERLTAHAQSVIPHWLHSNLMKRMALQWGLAMGREKWILVGMAIEAPMVYYFTGIRTVASFYWENAEGWKAEAAFFADHPNGSNARSIARQRGLTHACLNRSDELPKLYWYLATDRYSAHEAMRQTLAGTMAAGNDSALPPWLQLDSALTEIGQRTYVFRTPLWHARQQTRGIMYRIDPADNAKAASP